MGKSTSGFRYPVPFSSYSAFLAQFHVSSNHGSSDTTNNFIPSSPPSIPVAGPSHTIPTNELAENFNVISENMVLAVGSPGAKKKASKKSQNLKKPRKPTQPKWIRQKIDQHYKTKYLDTNYHIDFYRKVSWQDWLEDEKSFEEEFQRVRKLEESAQKAFKAKARRDGPKA